MTQPLHAELLDTAAMAAELGRHPGSLIRWRRLRRSPPYLRVNGRVLYRVADVMRWLDAQVVDQQAPRK